MESSTASMGEPQVVGSAFPPNLRAPVALVLHAHLPYVRHPEFPQFHEETWLFEAILESYLPLLRMLNGWQRDRVRARLTLSVSPTLAAMLTDPLLLLRFQQHMARLLDLTEQEAIRAHFEPRRRKVVEFFREWLRERTSEFDSLGGNLLKAFAQKSAEGYLELITCSATHATLPLLRSSPESLRAQLEIAMDSHARWTGSRPVGFWLPECAWVPELGPYLAEAGIRWCLVESHGLLNANPRPRQATFAPVLSPDGLAVFGRDPASARQVWSRQGGYPGDPRYREFHRDTSHDTEWEYIRPFLHGAVGRAFTGLKLHRVTGPLLEKDLYERHDALAASQEHARHFISERLKQATRAAEWMSRPPLQVAPYDAELFGHWWFEGPEFLDAAVRNSVGTPLEWVTPLDHLSEFPDLEVTQPAASTWGEGGHFAVWLDESNAWIQPCLRSAERRFQRLVQRNASLPQAPAVDRMLRQAARELLLAQSSDWPFLIHLNTAGSYPAKRIRDHLEAFHQLAQYLETGTVEDGMDLLPRLERSHPIFPELDWKIWSNTKTSTAADR